MPWQVQHRLADALSAARESAASRTAAFSVMAEWQRSMAAVKRDAFTERICGPHYERTLLRKLVGRWRTSARKLRHARIDAFWESSVVELRGALQSHYEPKLVALEQAVLRARDDAAAAWQAKDALGQQLKAAFMRGVSQPTPRCAGGGLPLPSGAYGPLHF